MPGLDVPCPACKRPELYYLSMSIGAHRCECGWQGLIFLEGPAGEYSVPVPNEEGLCRATRINDVETIIELELGPCRVFPFEGGLGAIHERGRLCYAATGQLIDATGIFVTEYSSSPRPPPCPCGSAMAGWVDGAKGHPFIMDIAERLGRKVQPHRCEGRVWLEIEGIGGRAARCSACKQVLVFPTYCEEESLWRREMEAKKMSVFVSYGGPDEEIAARIVHALTKKGVKTWFFPRDAVPGEKLHRTMFNAVNEHDRILLVCSRASLDRPGVLNELERVLERESREGGSSRLLPITLDKYVFSDWAPSRPDLAQQLRDRVICDFNEAAREGWTFHEKIDLLVKAIAS